MKDQQDNPENHGNSAKIHKAARAWKDLLLSLAARGYKGGTASILVPFDESGRVGNYRTTVTSPTADDS